MVYVVSEPKIEWSAWRNIERNYKWTWRNESIWLEEVMRRKVKGKIINLRKKNWANVRGRSNNIESFVIVTNVIKKRVIGVFLQCMMCVWTSYVLEQVSTTVVRDCTFKKGQCMGQSKVKVRARIMVKIIKPVHKNSISHFSEIGVVKLVSSTVFHS
jgi:hypothetical protein